MTRGRPLSVKSQAILAELRASRAQLTSAEVAARLQLARRDALVTCDRLAASGHLVIIRLAPNPGRRPAAVYATPAAEPVPACTVLRHGG